MPLAFADQAAADYNWRTKAVNPTRSIIPRSFGKQKRKEKKKLRKERWFLNQAQEDKQKMSINGINNKYGREVNITK